MLRRATRSGVRGQAPPSRARRKDDDDDTTEHVFALWHEHVFDVKGGSARQDRPTHDERAARAVRLALQNWTRNLDTADRPRRGRHGDVERDAVPARPRSGSARAAESAYDAARTHTLARASSPAATRAVTSGPRRTDCDLQRRGRRSPAPRYLARLAQPSGIARTHRGALTPARSPSARSRPAWKPCAQAVVVETEEAERRHVGVTCGLPDQLPVDRSLRDLVRDEARSRARGSRRAPGGVDLPANLVEVELRARRPSWAARCRWNASQSACFSRSRFAKPAFGHW